MSLYYMTQNKRYMKDGVLIAKDKIPANILDMLQPGDKIDDTGMDLKAPIKKCLFCGERSEFSRFVELQTVYLCDEHYYATNVGQIASKLKGAVSD